jgi:aerobic-type carbon monoxide dehydrogenase small subunit (CoxS/CutS family)
MACVVAPTLEVRACAVLLLNVKGKAVSTVTGLEWPTGFQEVKVPRFHDNGTRWW